jgi:hypothetical protein
MPATSVLAFIVPKLGIQAENAVSDCLYFILSTYSKAADSFINYLQLTRVVLPKPLQFATQVMWEHAGGRPDILGKSGEQAFLVIESKFDAPLTKSQPVDYVRYLPKDSGGVLLFITPAARSEDLWQALVKRCKTARIPIGSRIKHKNGLLTAPLRETHCLALAPWESLISTLLQDLPRITIALPPLSHGGVRLNCCQYSILALQRLQRPPSVRSRLQRSNKCLRLYLLVLGFHNDVNIVKIPRPGIECTSS